MHRYRPSSLMIGNMNVAKFLIFFAMLFSIGLIPNNSKAATEAQPRAQIDDLVEQVELIRMKIERGVSNSTTGSGYGPKDNFIEPVVYGVTNDSVLFLQTILATDFSIYPSGITTGYFGSMTVDGLKKFQAKYKLPVTGTFTSEIKDVLNSVLEVEPFDYNTEDYLTRGPVFQSINTSVNNYTLVDTVVNGKVVLRAKPTFSPTVKSSDTATLQRIMKTDGLIFKGTVTGLMDAETVDGVIKLRARYGIPYVKAKNPEVKTPNVKEKNLEFNRPGLIQMQTLSGDQAVEIASLMNAQTLTVINKILTVNNAPTISARLLKKPTASPAKINGKVEKNILSIRAVKDFEARRTSVVVTYSDRKTKKFSLPLVKPEATITERIATKLNRPAADFAGKLTFGSVNGKNIDKIEVILKPHMMKEPDFNVTFLDESTEFRRITPDEADQVISFYFANNEERFFDTIYGYIREAREGVVSENLISFVSQMSGVSMAKVRNILTVKVEEPPNDNGGNSGA